MLIPSTRVEKIEHILEMSCLIRFLFIKKQMGNVFKCLEAIRTFLKIVVDLIKENVGKWKWKSWKTKKRKTTKHRNKQKMENQKDKNSCYYFVSSVFLIVLSCFCFSLLF